MDPRTNVVACPVGVNMRPDRHTDYAVIDGVGTRGCRRERPWRASGGVHVASELDDLAASDHVDDVAQGAEIVQGIAIEDQKIGELTWLDRAE